MAVHIVYQNPETNKIVVLMIKNPHPTFQARRTADALQCHLPKEVMCKCKTSMYDIYISQKEDRLQS